jgi:hypothetical protein
VSKNLHEESYWNPRARLDALASKVRPSRSIEPSVLAAMLTIAMFVITGSAAAAQLKLVWDWSGPNGTSTIFKVERKTEAVGTYEKIAETPTGVKEYVDTTVANDTTYCYRVRASASSVDSPYSAEACGSVPSSSTGSGGSGSSGTAAGEIIIDNAAAGVQDSTRSFSGSWCSSSAASPYGQDSLDSCSRGTGDRYRWTPSIPTTGNYDVYVRWTAGTSRSTAVPFYVKHACGTNTRVFNEQSGGATWLVHGTYTFNSGTTGYVETTSENGQASADAVRFVPSTASLSCSGGSTSGTSTSLGASPASVAPGGSATVAWSGVASATARDWIGLFAPGSANTSFIDWVYVSCSKSPSAGRASGSCSFPIAASVAAGTYEFRLFADNGYTLLAKSGTISVSAPSGSTGSGSTPPPSSPTVASLSISPTSVSKGTAATVSWSGISSPAAKDWVGLFAKGASSTSFVDWFYVSCSKTSGSARASGSCSYTMPSNLAPGTYEMRLSADNGYTLLATSPQITATGLTASPGDVQQGANVTATWGGVASPAARDWIGLYAPGAAATSYIDWVYASCSKTPDTARASGSCLFRIPAGLAQGSYELRLYSDSGYQSISVSNRFNVWP